MFKRLFEGMGLFGQSGSNSYLDDMFSNINASGSVKIFRSEVKNQTAVSGSIKIDEAKLNTLNASGSIVMNNTSVKGEVNASGSWHVSNSKFEASMRLGVDNGIFDDCITQDIQVIETSLGKSGSAQKLHLNGKTIVNGDIRFDNQHGEVFLSNDSIIHGQVYGGVIRNSLNNHL